MAAIVERWPDFICIGAPKAGTTALFRAIGRHPQVFSPPEKEPRYFAYKGSRPHFLCPGGEESADAITFDRDEYLRLFGRCPSTQKTGDGSTGYLYHPEAPANCRAEVPSAPLIAVLRHPVDRAFSQFLHLRQKGIEEIGDFEAALDAESRRIELG